MEPIQLDDKNFAPERLFGPQNYLCWGGVLFPTPTSYAFIQSYLLFPTLIFSDIVEYLIVHIMSRGMVLLIQIKLGLTFVEMLKIKCAVCIQRRN